LQLQNCNLSISDNADNDTPNMTGVEPLKKLPVTRMALPVIMVSETMPTKELKQRRWLLVETVLYKPYRIRIY